MLIPSDGATIRGRSRGGRSAKQRRRICSSTKSDEAHLSDVFRNIRIIVVAAEEIVRRIVEQSQPLIENYAGIVIVSDVEVIRDEHF